VLTSPLLLAAALAIRLTSRGPALFRQRRVGLGGRPFTLLKLRTMRIGRDDSAYRELVRREMTDRDAAAGTTDGAFKLENDDRIFPVGRVLRRFSIDEIPQLVNVLRGDMAIVGPRPLEPFECALHSPYHAHRQLVRPGLTGLWQVSGRNLLGALEMLDLDVRYVVGRSWALDASIILRTPRAMLQGDGAR
jgi:lipopolysaccharide/colanic/teichoic acid biosynthesis glycosyltransferase